MFPMQSNYPETHQMINTTNAIVDLLEVMVQFQVYAF